jgi:hypothetical protein
VAMREDTKPETPLAKSGSEPPPSPSFWRPPGNSDTSPIHDTLLRGMPSGARIDWGFGSGRVRTFTASGPAALALAIVVLLVIGALIALFFVFAIGFGTVVALGAGAAAVLGLGANMWRRKLPSSHHHELGPHD